MSGFYFLAAVLGKRLLQGILNILYIHMNIDIKYKENDRRNIRGVFEG